MSRLALLLYVVACFAQSASKDEIRDFTTGVTRSGEAIVAGVARRFEIRIASHNLATGECSGEILWSASGARNPIRCKRSGASITFTETEPVRAIYSLTLSATGLSGLVWIPSSSTYGTVTIRDK